jgi:hypothetical protein
MTLRRPLRGTKRAPMTHPDTTTPPPDDDLYADILTDIQVGILARETAEETAARITEYVRTKLLGRDMADVLAFAVASGQPAVALCSECREIGRHRDGCAHAWQPYEVTS